MIYPSPWRIVKKLLKLEGAENRKYDADLDGTVDNSEALQGNPASAFAPASHTHTRSQITDMWSSPFWDNIPDKPSTFPPEAHTHTRSDITDFWSSPFWDNIPDAPTTVQVTRVGTNSPTLPKTVTDATVVVVSVQVNPGGTASLLINGGGVAYVENSSSNAGPITATLVGVAGPGDTYDVSLTNASILFLTENRIWL